MKEIFNTKRDITTIHKKVIQGNQGIQAIHFTYPYTTFNRRGIQGNQGNQGIRGI